MNQQKPTVKIAENGPYIVSGNLPLSKEIIGTNEGGESIKWQQGQKYPTEGQYALCRCGHSANKPFCAMAHIRKPDLMAPKPRASNRIWIRPKSYEARRCH